MSRADLYIHINASGYVTEVIPEQYRNNIIVTTEMASCQLTYPVSITIQFIDDASNPLPSKFGFTSIRLDQTIIPNKIVLQNNTQCLFEQIEIFFFTGGTNDFDYVLNKFLASNVCPSLTVCFNPFEAQISSLECDPRTVIEFGKDNPKLYTDTLKTPLSPTNSANLLYSVVPIKKIGPDVCQSCLSEGSKCGGCCTIC